MYSSLLRLDSFLSRRKNSSRIDVCSSYSNVDRNITVETLPFYHKILRYFSFTVTGGAIIPLYFLTSNFVNNVSLVISEKMWRVLHNAMLVVPSARMRMNKNIVFLEDNIAYIESCYMEEFFIQCTRYTPVFLPL